MKNYMISTIDGLSLINTFQEKQEDEVAALTAALSGLSQGLKKGIDIGDLGTIVINGSKGRYGMRYIDSERILGVLATDTLSEQKLITDIEEMASAILKN
ncbi:MAG: hypothetical protein KAG20_09390 [Cocleimonas sp.]|nr:hypothetical protein [Cocleimonas sp.]